MDQICNCQVTPTRDYELLQTLLTKSKEFKRRVILKRCEVIVAREKSLKTLVDQKRSRISFHQNLFFRKFNLPKCFTQVTINNSFLWIIISSETQMISSGQECCLLSHVHF